MTTQASLQFVTRTATSATQFVDSIGVNTHLGFALSPYSNVTLVKASLDYLGISNIRDGLYDNAAATQSFSA